MRAVKYQAWHKEERKMYRVIALYLDETGVQSVSLAPLENDVFALYGVPVTAVALREWSGFADATGRGIYEDDVVIRSGNPHFRYRVIYSETYGRWALRSLFSVKGGKPGYIALSRNTSRNQVVGTIYEQQETVSGKGGVGGSQTQTAK